MADKLPSPKRDNSPTKESMAAETEIIRKRLMEEGLLLRNKGTNSIKSLRETLSADLRAFMPIFKDIQNSLYLQTMLLENRADQEELIAEARRRMEDFGELESPQPQGVTAEENKRKEEKEKEDKKDALSIGKILKGSLGFLGTAAKVGTGLFIGYNFVKGFVNGLTDGGFTRMEDAIIETFRDIDWAGMKQMFLDFYSTMKEKLTQIKTFLGIDGVDDWLFYALGGFTAAKFATELAKAAASTAVTSIISGMVAKKVAEGVISGSTIPGTGGPVIVDTPDGPDGKGKGKGPLGGPLGKAKGALLASIGIGLVAYAGEIADWFRENALGMTPDEIANTPIDGVEVALLSAGTAATIAGVGKFVSLGAFAAGWPLAVASILGGTVIASGMAILDYMNEKEEGAKREGLPQNLFNILQKKEKMDAGDPAFRRIKLTNEKILEVANETLGDLFDERQQILSDLEAEGYRNARGKFVKYTQAQIDQKNARLAELDTLAENTEAVRAEYHKIVKDEELARLQREQANLEQEKLKGQSKNPRGVTKGVGLTQDEIIQNQANFLTSGGYLPGMGDFNTAQRFTAEDLALAAEGGGTNNILFAPVDNRTYVTKGGDSITSKQGDTNVFSATVGGNGEGTAAGPH